MSNTSVIFVLGCYRSGTSLVSSILAKLGVDFGQQLYPSSSHNPNGYFESEQINHFNTQLIEKAGFTLAKPGHPQEISRIIQEKPIEFLNREWINELCIKCVI
ncbi:MAG: hypothetical protein EAZ09_05655 [Oscillatoriales cyanobacterium]|jgi:hypothetical protein|nr:MAG: hypothetical protein EAZ18_03925 [Oscillatoriales cyanobacterium]TAH23953.1 MAG: hypothetical protein EAZ09_05655 [Oscillatoriales cyanobacterium]